MAARSEGERQLARSALVETPGQRHGGAGEAAHGVAASALALVPSGIQQGNHRVSGAVVLGPLGRSFHGEGLATAATVASVGGVQSSSGIITVMAGAGLSKSSGPQTATSFIRRERVSSLRT